MDIIGTLKKFITDSRHVLAISYKPTQDEFKRAAKIIIIGIVIIGMLGLIMAIIVSLAITSSLALV